jgi:F0F1-type ATP synthase epsilon subunit
VKPGLLKYRRGNKDHVAAVSAGFVEAGPTKVLLLTDHFALPKDIDEAAVKADLSGAEKDLAAYRDRYEGNQYEELQRRIDWCNAQLLAKSSEPR